MILPAIVRVTRLSIVIEVALVLGFGVILLRLVLPVIFRGRPLLGIGLLVEATAASRQAALPVDDPAPRQAELLAGNSASRQVSVLLNWVASMPPDVAGGPSARGVRCGLSFGGLSTGDIPIRPDEGEGDSFIGEGVDSNL